MTVDRSNDYYLGVLQELRKLPVETEWFECKHNNDNPDEIGEFYVVDFKSTQRNQFIT